MIEFASILAHLEIIPYVATPRRLPSLLRFRHATYNISCTPLLFFLFLNVSGMQPLLFRFLEFISNCADFGKPSIFFVIVFVRVCANMLLYEVKLGIDKGVGRRNGQIL